jgi:GTPase SAR1 family protein
MKAAFICRTSARKKENVSRDFLNMILILFNVTAKLVWLVELSAGLFLQKKLCWQQVENGLIK